MQSIEDSEDFVWVSADVEVGHRYKAYDALRIDDICRALRNSLVRIEDTQFGREFTLDVAQPRIGAFTKVVVFLSPRKVNKFRINACADELGISVSKVLVKFPEAHDFRWANKSEILGPEKIDGPLSFKRLLRQRLEWLFGTSRSNSFQGIRRKFLANTDHNKSSFTFISRSKFSGIREELQIRATEGRGQGIP